MPKPPAHIVDEYDIDHGKWGQDFDPNNPDNLNKETVNGYILYCIEYYKKEYDDIRLWEAFREDFAGWKKETFALGNARVVREFRDWLRAHGVWVRRDGGPVAIVL